MSYDDTVRLFHSGKRVGQSAFQRFPTVHLAKLCDAYGLRVEGTSKRPSGSKKKLDYINVILNVVNNKASVTAATRQSSPMSIYSDNRSLDVEMGSPDIEMNSQDSTATRKGGPIPIESTVKRNVRIRVYAQAKDYDWLLEREITLEHNGDLSIQQIQQELGEGRTCCIIDPSNYKPMHLYKPGALAAGDVSRLRMKMDGYLRVIFK